jgi:threonylcarbamoyladenosine tRNA methylthiotransferase MtaB
MNNRTFYIKTLGCKLNFSESATLERMLVEKGYCIAANATSSDIYIINTCAVTETAEKKCRQYIHQVKKQNPQAKIVLVGCYSALENSQAIVSEVDLMLGSGNKSQLIGKIDSLFEQNNHTIIIKEKPQEPFFTSYSIDERTRSFLKIQDGCDYFCTYCTVAYARGRSRSDSIENIISYARDIVSNNVKEIVLSGVNIGDFRTEKGELFIDLLYALEKIKDLKRIRISSIEPNLLTDEIIDLVSKSNKILPHFHIPLQSGSNEILSKMKRRYKRELFAEKIYLIKEKMPDCCVAADVIVGFPGETDTLFEETYHFIEEFPLSMLHVFPYSKRPNTIAATMENQLSNTCKNKRANALIELSNKKKTLFYQQNILRECFALIESKKENGFLTGFTDNYIRIKIPSDATIINQIVKVKILEIDTDGVCKAEIIER